MTATTYTYFPEETVRFTVADLTHIDDGAVTAGATVTFSLIDASDTQVATGTGAATGDDWTVDVNLPALPGHYILLATAVVDGVTWKGRTALTIVAFS